MNTKRTLVALAFCLATAVACFAADTNVGTWKLNESKSKIAAGAPKNTSVVYSEEGDQYKCVVDGVDGSGKPAHNEWTGKFDGKDYPLTGDPTSDTRSVKKVDDHHYELTNKKDGKPVVTGTIEFSADGKTRTLHLKMHDAKGKSLTATQVYDRQ